MSRRVQRVRYHLDPQGIQNLPVDEIKVILRGADDLIMSGGRTLLAKVLKGSRAREVLNLGLERSPIYGYYRQLSLEDILARIDWVILNDYLAIAYDGRLPLLRYTATGWDIEKEIYADELLRGFDALLVSNQRPFDLTYLKDRESGLIMRLLAMVEATGDPKYVPVLEAWAQVDYQKVQYRIRQVIQYLNSVAG